jgi:hypothetical protein
MPPRLSTASSFGGSWRRRRGEQLLDVARHEIAADLPPRPAVRQQDAAVDHQLEALLDETAGSRPPTARLGLRPGVEPVPAERHADQLQAVVLLE